MTPNGQFDNAEKSYERGRALAAGYQAARNAGVGNYYLGSVVGRSGYDVSQSAILGGAATGLLGRAGAALFRGPISAAEGEVAVGTNVTRTFGGESDLYGRSWTTDPIGTLSRNSVGLETNNSGEFIAHGVVVDSTGITTQEATAWGRFAGGAQETLVPNAATQIQIRAVTMPGEPLPWSLPTDPRPLPPGP